MRSHIRRLFTPLLISCALVACKGPARQEAAESEVKKDATVADLGIIIGEQPKPDTLKGSPKAFAATTIGNKTITINYYSPAVRGRVIWGGLVPLGQVWVTGAHKATNIEFETDVRVGDTTLEKGKYAFFTMPGEENWTLILNRNWDQHLADEYDQKEDVARIVVKPEHRQTMQERLRYTVVGEDGTHGRIELYWEKLLITLPFELVEQ